MEIKKWDFYEFFLQAWRASIYQRSAWVFGLIIAVATVVTLRLDIVLPHISSSEKFAFMIFSEGIYGEMLLVFLWLALFFAVSAFGKGNLIVSLSYLAGKISPPNYPRTAKAMRKNFLRALVVDATALFSVLAAVGIILLPLGIASASNPNVMNSLITLGLLTLIPIIIIVCFIRQYTLFYFLLSPLSLRGAIETSCALFSRFFVKSLLFGLFFGALVIFFTFCLELAILAIVFLARKISVPLEEQTISLATSFVFFIWLAVFQQALWLAFFRSIADTRDIQKTVAEKSEAFAGNLSEIPPVKNTDN